MEKLSLSSDRSAALDNKSSEANRARLSQLEDEIASLKIEQADLTERWMAEKGASEGVTELSEKIAQVKFEIEKAERDYDLARAAELKISPHVEPTEIGEMIDGWCRECSASSEGGYTVGWKSVGMGPMDYEHALTKVDASNPWFQVFADRMSSMGHKIVPQVFPAATDSRFLRQLGIRAFGFSPMRNTEVRNFSDDTLTM
jgi:hypothetical protein